MQLRAALFFAAATLAFSLAPITVRAEAPATQLQTVTDDVARRFPDVVHVDQTAYDRLQASGNAVVFDVRTPEEYAVSHLDGAIATDPKMPADAFLARYGATLKGKTAVFYCSVGMRSSKLATRVAQGLKASGAANVVNLKGGIFAWANAARPLIDAQGSTTNVHGYDASWGKLLEKK